MRLIRAAFLAAFLFAFMFGGVSSQSAPMIICEYGEPVMYGPAAGPYLFTPHAIVIHHSADNGATAENEALRWEGYRRYHKETVHPGIYPEWTGIYIAQEGYPDGLSWPNQRDYNDIDYHYGVGISGTIYQGRDPRTVGWHAGGSLPGMPEINTYSLGVCFIGDFTYNPPNNSQYWAGVKLVADLCIQYKISFTEIYGHKEIRWSTACPGNAFPLSQFKEDVRMQIAGFYDVSYSDWFWPYIQAATSKGILKGYEDKTFKPESPITRAEFVTVLYRLANGKPEPTTLFWDTYGHWAINAISWAKANNIVFGYQDGSFRPDEPLTRAEAAAILARYLNLEPFPNYYYTDIPAGYWASDQIGACLKAAILVGYSDWTFKPENLFTRTQMAITLTRVK